MSWAVNDSVHGFTVRQVTPIHDFEMQAIRLVHDRTGADYLHVARADPNNTFLVGFCTPPTDDTGIAHILEHTTLCGSEKYPCRDPFFKMLTRSLSTFMNAMTGGDFTVYPFSTTNPKDYANLLSVYLDAVFFPRLERLDFLQEGWRLEHEDPEASTSPIIYKGVVYNEMKGALSSLDYLYAVQAQQHLFPGSTYGHASGGDPAAIPDLTYEELKQFHVDHYHPSNAKFYSYGDLPLEHHLESVNSYALQHFEALPEPVALHTPGHWAEPRRVHATGPVDPMAGEADRQTRVSVAFNLGAPADATESILNQLACSLLVDGPNAPFFKALIDGNLGNDFTSNTGYDGSTLDASFAVGLQGIREEDVELVVERIHATLAQVAEDSFTTEAIEAILHQVELSQKHQRTSFGMNMGVSTFQAWNHGHDPIEAIDINDALAQLRATIEADPAFLKDYIRTTFLENTHHLTFVMSPSEQYHEELGARESERLASHVGGLTQEDRDAVKQVGLELMEAQNTEEPVDCLPLLGTSEIERTALTHEVEHASHATPSGRAVPVQWSLQPTNDICYFRSVIDAAGIPEHLQAYIPVFCAALTSLGTDGRDYRELAQDIKSVSGGLNVSPMLVPDANLPGGFSRNIAISSHCLDRNLDSMFALWQDVMASPRFDEQDHLRTIVGMMAADAANSIAGSGHSYAMMSAASTVSGLSAVSETYSGLSQVALLSDLAGNDDMDLIVAKIREVGQHVFGSPARMSMVCGHQAKDRAEAAMFAFADALPAAPQHAAGDASGAPHARPTPASTFHEMPVTINFAARAVPTVPYTHPDSPTLSVLASVLSSKFLHREIRCAHARRLLLRTRARNVSRCPRCAHACCFRPCLGRLRLLP